MRLLPLFSALLLFAAADPADAQAWPRAHNGADNTGFRDIETTPVQMGTFKTVVSGLGPFAPGVGPLIGRDGTAYLGALNGEVKAIASSGATLWTMQLPRPLKIMASPLIGADGSIYVVAMAGPFRDHRGRRDGTPRYEASLFRLAGATGAIMWQMALPEHGRGGGVPAAALNGFGEDAGEVILVPVQTLYSASTFDSRLLGYAPDGRLLFDEDIGGTMTEAITGANTCRWYDLVCWLAFDKPLPPPYFAPVQLPADARAAIIGAAVAPGNIIVTADAYRTIRGYRYEPGVGVSVVFEKIDPRRLTSSVAAWPNSRSVYAVGSGRIAFSGPSDERVADIRHARDEDSILLASPTRLANDWLVTVDLNGQVTIVDNVVPIRRHRIGAQTIAPATASRTHFYISSANALVTFDAATLDEVARFEWEGGGLSSPAISHLGRVYALAADKLYMFRRAAIAACVPRPGRGPGGGATGVGSGCEPPPIADPR